MSGHLWTFIEDATGWQLGRIGPDGPLFETLSATAQSEPAELAGFVAEKLIAHGYAGEGIAIAIHATQCLVGRLPIDETQRALRRNRRTLLFEMEGQLPLSAEELTADYAFSPDSVLAVAVQTGHLTPLLEALQEQGVQVQLLAPAALLAAQTVVSEQQHATGDVVVVWSDSVSDEKTDAENIAVENTATNDTATGRTEIIVLRNGEPIDWRSIGPGVKPLLQQVRMLALRSSRELAIVGRSLTEDMQTALENDGWRLLESAPTPLADAVLDSTDRILAAQLAPWIDLRRDALAATDPYRPVRGLISAIAVMAAILLIAISGGLLFRAQRHEQQAEVHQQAQEDLFREILPGQKLPRGIRRRLESELAKVSGLRGQGTDLPENPSALVVLHQVLTGLPESVRFRVNELRLNQGRIFLDGEVRSHADADRLAAALRGHGFDVGSPRTEQLPSRGVSVRLSGLLAKLPTAKNTTDEKKAEAAAPVKPNASSPKRPTAESR